jgi:hypothetical protein
MVTRQAGVAAAFVLALYAASGCAHSKSASEGASADVITEDDIARVHARTAYDAVAKIHANFLTRRGETSLLNTSNPEPNVYLDDVLIGSATALKGIEASVVATIRVYRAWETPIRFGAGNMGGVIEVYTKH